MDRSVLKIILIIRRNDQNVSTVIKIVRAFLSSQLHPTRYQRSIRLPEDDATLDNFQLIDYPIVYSEFNDSDLIDLIKSYQKYSVYKNLNMINDPLVEPTLKVMDF
jgi:hypothetical protein